MENINQMPNLQPIEPISPIKNQNLFKYLFIASVVILLFVIIAFYFVLNNKINRLEDKQTNNLIPTSTQTEINQEDIVTETETTQTAVSPITPTSIITKIPTVTSISDPKQEITSALNPTNKPNFTVSISKIIGNYATGGAGAIKDGPGYGWIAAKVNGVWKIVTTGQDAPACNIVNQYQVPKEIYGSCY